MRVFLVILLFAGWAMGESKKNDSAKVAPEAEKALSQRVIQLLNKADRALNSQQYDKVIEYTNQIRQIQLSGTTAYLEEADRMAARAREALGPQSQQPGRAQGGEVAEVPEGPRYPESVDGCEAIVKRNPASPEAKECLKAGKETQPNPYVKPPVDDEPVNPYRR